MSQPPADATTNRAHPIGIVVAMQAELRHLLELVTVEGMRKDGPWLESFATVNGVPIVMVRSGMGMVNAAAGTESLINAHQPQAIINFGCTGAHRRDILAGDVVIGTQTVHHSKMNILADGTEFFEARGGDVGGESWHPTVLDTDPSLLAAARAAAAGWTPEPWPAAFWPAGVPAREPQVHVGPVASADIWTQHVARLDMLHDRHGTLCEDMEAAAIAQVCGFHQVPFLTIKDLSNNEFHASTDIAGGFSDFPTEEVGKRAAALTLRLLEQLGSVE
jgi:adenosylhomocysteine nucleosidase